MHQPPLGANTLYVNTGGRDGENRIAGYPGKPSRNATGRGGRVSAKQIRVSGISPEEGGPEGDGASKQIVGVKKETDRTERPRGKGRLYLELVAYSGCRTCSLVSTAIPLVRTWRRLGHGHIP
ncbi:hypothetical protein ACFQ5D_11255 [Paenibacillus farraposensis]|uniref:Uncharacterized protein n=1 Tax=Paenibacillus farraposensis TaxID=2807095 RepID=A0ABW4DB84_9BACL|nr:hypothetical protein [Paenibacillus farraposensis]MCC3378677.1 hypothetical protein [Paenibacillus farraposensis]